MIEIELDGGFNISKTRNEDGKTVTFALDTKNGNSAGSGSNSQSACRNKPSSKARPSPDPKLTKYLNMDEEELKSRLLEKKPELSVEDLMGVSTRQSSPNKKKKGSKRSTQGISQDKSYTPPTHKPKKKDNSSKERSNTLRNMMSDALKASKTSSDVAKTLLQKSDQESTTEGKRQTKKLLREALSVSKTNAEVAASLCRQSNVALKTKENKLVLKEFEDCSTDDSTDASSSNESKEGVLSRHTGQRADKKVMMISSRISKKFPRIPESQIRELVSEALIIAEATRENKVKKTRKEKYGGGASNFRDILRVMKSSKSKKEEDCDDKFDDVLSLLSVDSSQSCSRLRELMKDGRTPEESVEYLLSNTQRCVANVVQTAVKEGKTPQEIGEILLKLEEERVIALEKREEKMVERKNKHLARLLVAEAVAAGAGGTPNEIAEFIMKREAQKTTKELVEKAMKECETPEEIAAYLLKVSGTQGTQNDLAEERTGAKDEESSWTQKISSFVKKVSEPSPSKPPSTSPAQSFALLDACSVEESADNVDVCASLKNGIQNCVDDNAELLNDMEDTADYILNVGVDGAEMCASGPVDDGSLGTNDGSRSTRGGRHFEKKATTLNDIIEARDEAELARLASF